MSQSSEANRLQVGGDHYMEMAVQPWQAMQSWLTPEQFEGFMLGNAIKYLARYNAAAPGKGGLQDLQKSHHYVQKLIEQVEKKQV